VSRRMLGPEIEGEIAQGGFGHNGLASAAVQRRPLTAVPALFVTPGQATTPISRRGSGHNTDSRRGEDGNPKG